MYSEPTGWISVKDQLPPIKRYRYLCYFRFEPESPDVIAENFYYGPHYNYGLWLDSSSKVTHWMPLPDPPDGMPDYDQGVKVEQAKKMFGLEREEILKRGLRANTPIIDDFRGEFELGVIEMTPEQAKSVYGLADKLKKKE